MKKAMNYSAMLLAAAVTFLSSCKKTDDPAPADVVPDVKLTMNQSNSTGNANQNDTVTIDQGTNIMQVTALTATNNDMSRLYVYLSKDGGGKTNVSFANFKQDSDGNYYYDIANASRNNFTIDMTAQIENNASRNYDTYYFYFTSGAIGNVSSPSNVQLGPGTITLYYTSKMITAATAQKMYNVCAPGGDFSAYNLVTTSGVTCSVAGNGAITVSSGADMAQQTGTANCSSFNGWVAQNSSVFVKANALDFSTVTYLKASDVFQNGTQLSGAVTGVAADDVYVVKLRGGSTYAVIKITGVTSNGNSSYYQFDIKK